MASTNVKVSNHIHDDLAFSILSKLPIKSLKQFTCVHKSWTLLFENTYFMKIFTNKFISRKHSLDDDTYLLLRKRVQMSHHHSELYLISGEGFENSVRLDLPPPFEENDHIPILGLGINGILCLYNSNKNIVLWNPTTKEFKVTPSSPDGFPLDVTNRVSLYGFGYDHVRDDYKVIRTVSYFPIGGAAIRPKPSWQIYSLRSDCWRILDIDMPVRHNTCIEGREVYLNGMCHWWGKVNLETYLVSFNFSNEVFFTTPLPLDVHDSFDSKWVQRHFVLFNGSIVMISKYEKTASFHISILGEPGVKESWVKLSILRASPNVPLPPRPIGISKKRDTSLKRIDNELIRVCINIQTLEEIGIKGSFSGCQIVRYKKNLLTWRNQ